ncbi:MAG: phosphodiesterase [Bacteroidales bacterium]
MKILIISDIHGCATSVRKVLSYYDSLNPDHILLLGDILYHGPRNPIPEGYDPQQVVALLNPLKEKIIAVRGNCEAEVDQMLLEFPCMSDYAEIYDSHYHLFATHGHLYYPAKLPCLNSDSVFLYGHTHIWELKKKNDCSVILFNPGSITFPKEQRLATFGFYDSGTLSVRGLEDNVILAELSVD